jgi:hypothetical protein
MSRESIFDPRGNQTEHSGSTFTPPRADNNSHMPPDVIDGEVGPQEDSDLQKLAQAVDESEAERLNDLSTGKTDPDDAARDEAP